MKFRVEWTQTGPPLTLEKLSAQPLPHTFFSNNALSAGIVDVELLPASQERCSLVVAHDVAMPTRLRGSTIVIPMKSGPPLPLA